MDDVRFKGARSSDYLVEKKFGFCASHVLPNHPGKCRRLHGHNYTVTVRFGGYELTENNAFLIDFADISKVVKPLVEQLDHQHLGYGNVGVIYGSDNYAAVLGPNFYPSAENLAAWFGKAIIKADESFERRLSSVSISETRDTLATWYNNKMRTSMLAGRTIR